MQRNSAAVNPDKTRKAGEDKSSPLMTQPVMASTLKSEVALPPAGLLDTVPLVPAGAHAFSLASVPLQEEEPS